VPQQCHRPNHRAAVGPVEVEALPAVVDQGLFGDLQQHLVLSHLRPGLFVVPLDDGFLLVANEDVALLVAKLSGIVGEVVAHLPIHAVLAAVEAEE